MAEAGLSDQTFQKVTVIGAGAWGTTLACLLADKGLHVRLWAYESDLVKAIRTKQENTLFLPGVKVPPSISPTASLADALKETQLLVFAVPSHAARSVLRLLAPLLPAPRPLISATNGIEEDSLKLMSEVIRDTLS